MLQLPCIDPRNLEFHCPSTLPLWGLKLQPMREHIQPHQTTVGSNVPFCYQMNYLILYIASFYSFAHLSLLLYFYFILIFFFFLLILTSMPHPTLQILSFKSSKVHAHSRTSLEILNVFILKYVS